VKQEAADELVGCERHDALPLPAIAPVVFVAEGDAGYWTLKSVRSLDTQKRPFRIRPVSGIRVPCPEADRQKT
jgi:hypothetical protein